MDIKLKSIWIYAAPGVILALDLALWGIRGGERLRILGKHLCGLLINGS